MPTTEFAIPDSRKKIFQQKVLQAVNPITVVYRGKTTGASATELFINGVAGVSTDRNRVYVPEDAAIVGRYTSLAINMGTGATMHHTTGFIGINNDGGTTAMTAVPAATEHVDVGAAYVVAFTANDTEDALICTVTGVAATNVLWVVAAELLCLSIRSLPPYGDS